MWGDALAKAGYCYIMASGRNATLYIGATSDLIKRGWEHRNGVMPGFTKQHRCTQLVWFAMFDDIADARGCEARMKKWNRAWKLRAIEEMNPLWHDLYPTLL